MLRPLRGRMHGATPSGGIASLDPRLMATTPRGVFPWRAEGIGPRILPDSVGHHFETRATYTFGNASFKSATPAGVTCVRNSTS